MNEQLFVCFHYIDLIWQRVVGVADAGDGAEGGEGRSGEGGGDAAGVGGEPPPLRAHSQHQ